MRYNLVLLLACLIGNVSLAQDCKTILLGEIVDFHDNTPLVGATISITGVTSSNIGIESITINSSDTDITLDSVNVFTENSDFEIFYTESLQYNSEANQSVAVSAIFQSSSISVSYPTASIAAYSSSIVNG